MSITKKVVVALVVLLVAGAGGAYFFLQNRERPDPTARAYLRAWENGDYETMKAMSLSAPASFVEIYESIPGDLEATEYAFELGNVTSEGDSAVAEFEAHWILEGLGNLRYRSLLDLERRDDKWMVAWSPESIHPDFSAESTFERTRSWPQRGQIQGFDGNPITEERRMVVVGVEPRPVVDPAKVNADLNQPGLRDDWFLPVAEITAERYEEVRPIIYPVPGLVFQNRQQRLPPTPEFARHVLGTVGEVTAEGLESLGNPYRAGDRVGRSGLEAAFEKQLAGTPCLLYTSPSPRDRTRSRMPSSA